MFGHHPSLYGLHIIIALPWHIRTGPTLENEGIRCFAGSMFLYCCLDCILVILWDCPESRHPATLINLIVETFPMPA